ncbi:MAG: hypothetical protein NTW85_14930 [Methylococcales bacterium]|nr:hypothetical protein [Methylococcales bacterium]
MKINFFVDNEYHAWNGHHHEIYIIRADQTVYFELFNVSNNENPVLFIENDELDLTAVYSEELGNVFRSVSGSLFRESFGLAIVNIHLAEQRFELRFEVIVKKANAQQVEEMIRYLTHKQNDIMRICLSRTDLSIENTSDPETILNTAETFVNTLISCRLELQYHLRKRLIPIKQAAWKASQNSDIDPFDIIFNLDALEPVLGEGDVVVNGRSFSITETEVTTLEQTANVKENAILLGGLYSMRRIITTLLDTINPDFAHSKIAYHDPDYESLNDVLSRLTSSNMKQRCENQLLQLEEFIRYFEKNLAISYQGELRPIMTPFVRASRVYRRLFEQLHDWYILGEPSLNGRNYLAKLRSVSKLYEFVALFKLIDYLYDNNWTTIDTHWSSQLEFVPSIVTFKRNGFKLTLSYEPKVFPYSVQTKHADLVDMKHATINGDYDYWCPDLVLRIDSSDKTVYLVFDAKYSSASSVRKYHLPSLLEKYFINMAVYDAYSQLLKQEPIVGVIALFPDKNAPAPIYLPNWTKYGLHKRPTRLPIVTGLAILPELDTTAYPALDQLFAIAERQLN